MTPTWSETAWWADYVLPMGHGPERHDTHSYETHAGRWLGFRQPVQRVAMERAGHHVEFTYEANPGEVWEEGEFWIEVSWRADPDGSLGIRRYYESPYRPGEKIRLEEYYRWMFENSVPGLPEKAAAEGLDPLAYMRRYGVVEISARRLRRPRAGDPRSRRRRDPGPGADAHTPRGEGRAPPAHRPPGHGRGGRRRRAPSRLQHALAQARAVLQQSSPNGAGRRWPRRTTSAATCTAR